MKPASLSAFVAFVLLCTLATGAVAQHATPSAKPRAQANTPAAATTQKRVVIRAPEPTASPAPAAIAEAAAREQLPSALPDPITRIEQVRQGRRIAEVVVTPGGYSHSYVMVNREPKAPQGPVDTGTGLSVPRFVRINF